MFTLGQVPFAASSDWNTPITEGSTYTPLAWPAPTGYNYSVAWDSYSPAVYVGSPTDPLVQVYHPATWGYPAGYVYVHLPAAADGAAGTDGELLVIDGDIVYNFWQFERTSLTTATAVSFGQENVVTGDGWGSKSPFLGAGITAVGASQLGGLLVKAETDTGVINHALQLTVEFNLAKSGFTGDAIAGDGSSSTGIVQEGDHLAIPLGTPMPSGLSPLAQEVFIALQNYGAYVVDVSGGTTNLRAQANAYDDATMTALWHDLSKITPLLQEVHVAAGAPPVVTPPPTTTDPLAPTIAVFSPDSNTVGDGITNASILTLTGTAAAGSTVKIYDGTPLIGTTTANSSGAWSFKTGTLSNATHNFTATATTAEGSISPASSVLSVKVDTVAPVAPTITGFSPDSSPVGDGSTNASTLTLTGTAEANSSVRVFDGTTLLGTTKANASGAWSYTTASLTVGAHSFAATATDTAGNTGPKSAALMVTVQQSSSGQNLIVNGSFETGDFSGWTLSGNVAPLSYGPQAFIVNSAMSGDYAAGFGPVGSDGKLSQDIQTTAGQHYTLSFWLANASGGPDDFAVKWNGQTLLAMVNKSAQGYTEYKFDVVGAAGTSHLEFDFRQDPSYWSIDSISLTPTGAPVTNTLSDPAALSGGTTAALVGVANSDTGGNPTTSDNALTANVALLSQYTAASFPTSSDGFGGTLIQDALSDRPQTLTPPQPI